MASTILSDNGASSGSAGLKTTADGTGALALQTTTTGGTATTAMTIDTSQNVGIGTSSPSQKLSVVGPDNNAYTNVISAYSNNLAQSTSLTYAGLRAVAGAGLGFYVNGSTTANASIDSSGNLLVGTTSVLYSAKLTVAGNISSSGTQFNVAGGADYEFVQRSAYKMNFYVNSASVLATLSITGVWTNASDARYKENITDSQYGLSTVMALKPRAYNLIGLEDKPQVGFIAQEVMQTVPEVVESVRNSVTEEERYTLSYGNLTAVLTKAIQEQQALITQLQADVAALKGAQA